MKGLDSLQMLTSVFFKYFYLIGVGLYSKWNQHVFSKPSVQFPWISSVEVKPKPEVNTVHLIIEQEGVEDSRTGERGSVITVSYSLTTEDMYKSFPKSWDN